MSDIKETHDKICHPFQPFQNAHLQFSLDGVQESKSSGVSIDAFTLKFNECRNIYPIRCVKPYNRIKYDEQESLAIVLNDIINSNCVIDNAICDNPKRAILRNALCHSSLYACEYCEASAQSHLCPITKTKVERELQIIENKISELEEKQMGLTHEDEQYEILDELLTELRMKHVHEGKKIKKKHLVWPSHTRHGQLRTVNAIRDISRAIATGRNSDEESEELTRDERVGIVGTSLLLSQPHFNMIKGLPAEYMHSVCLGIVRRLLELTFKIGQSQESLSKRTLCPPVLYNSKICYIRVPREFNRRGRFMDLSIMKAQEMRNILLFFFPLIIDCIGNEYPKDQAVWLLLTYMIRACVIPNPEYQAIDPDFIHQCSAKFYKTYETVHGTSQCSYSIHVVSSHLLQIRADAPLTFKSAFKFETFYGEMKNCFQPGTSSTLKQLFKNVIMKRCIEYHVCETSIFYKPDKKKKPNSNQPKECNSIIYTYENAEYNFYKILSIDNELFTCVRFGRYPVQFHQVPELNWSKVGVFRIGPTASTSCTIRHNQICGKALIVDKYVISCPNNVLREK